MAPETADITKLIQTCRDGEAGFATAAESVSDPHLRKLLVEYSEQRAQFAVQLRVLGRQADLDLSDEGSSAPGTLHRAVMKVRSAITTDVEAAVLQECVRGEESAIRVYREALASSSLPGPIRETINVQHVQIEEVRGRLTELLAHLQALRPVFE